MYLRCVVHTCICCVVLGGYDGLGPTPTHHHVQQFFSSSPTAYNFHTSIYTHTAILSHTHTHTHTAMNAQISYLDNVDGSCLYSCNDTKVVAAATGPVEPKARQELPTQLALELNVRPAAGVATTREVNVQDKVRAVITPLLAAYKYPRQLCQLTLQLLQSGEAEECFHCLELVACVNAAVFALVDAGVALTSVALGTTVAITCNGQELVVDPSSEVLKSAQSVHSVVFQINEGKPQSVLLMDSFGDFSQEDILRAMERAQVRVGELNSTFRKTILAKANIV